MATFVALRHFWCDHLAVFGEELARLGHAVVALDLSSGEALPSLEHWDAVIVLGGPMSVHDTDQYPFLAAEVALLTQAIALDFPVLGVCLGSQLIAQAAGAAVYRGARKEIGLYPIHWTDAAREDPLLFDAFEVPEVFQWHGETFDLPEGAMLLASTDRYPHQAFRLGRNVYGLQFHLEIDPATLGRLRAACGQEIEDLPPEESLDGYPAGRLEEGLDRQNGLARRVIGRFADLVERRKESVLPKPSSKRYTSRG